MAQQAETKFLILWEHEVRAAAWAFADAHRLQDDDAASEDDRSMAIANALRLADAALHGANDDDAVLILAKPRDIFAKRSND